VIRAILTAVLLAASIAHAAEPPCYVPIDVRSVRIIDGDCFAADILLPWGVTLRNRKCRTNYDACEVSRIRQGITITDAEIQRGHEATESLLHLFKHSEAAYIVPQKEEFAGFNRLHVGLFLKIRTEPQLLDVRVWMEAHKYTREEPQ
jgi:hypothetical protein